MYLYTRQEKPLIAEHDIKCYVYIRKELVGEGEEEHGIKALYHKVLRKNAQRISLATKFYEPFRNEKLKPNSLNKPKSTRVYSGEYNGRNHYRIEEGYIQGMLRADEYGVAQPYDAYIPVGAEYYINNGLFRVAANEMRIMSQAQKPLPPLEETLKPILPQLAESMFGYDDEIKPGFYYTQSKFVNPNKLNPLDASSVCGIVCNVDGNKITVMSLKEGDLIWSPEEKCTLINNKPKNDGEHRYNEFDADGESNTLNIIRSDNYGADFSAVNFCNSYNTYGGMSGRWYLGSSLEVVHMVRENMQPINVAIAMLGGYQLLDGLAHYWTSTEFNENYALSVDASDGCVTASMKYSHCKVRAFMKLDKPVV